MNRRIGIVMVSCLLASLAIHGGSGADEPQKVAVQQEKSANGRNKDAQKLREDKFKESLSEVVFLGSWQMTNAEGLKGKAPMSPPQSDRYVIKGVSKGLDDNWVSTARVQFADRDVELPFNVRVVWAEDVPIITLDKTPLPMLGTYSARVMITDGFYAGTWFGTTYGGVMQGQIIKAADEKMIEELSKKRDEIKLQPKPTTQSAE
ncbi:MAG: hypothetical protein IPK83_01350 [Planctomycetes bacterium]|nr:hypothetical protein [Planctomycetota bacterium]